MFYENIDGTVFGTANDTAKGTQNSTVKEEKLSPSEKKVMNALSSNGSLTRKELSERLRLSERTISRILDLLKKKGLIWRVGSDKAGFWKVEKKHK